MGPVRAHAVPCGCTPCAPAANVSSGLLARFSPHLELSMQGEPTSVHEPCCREVIIEGQEQLPLQQECSAGEECHPRPCSHFDGQGSLLSGRWSG
jgi:hypothetical protein